MGMFSASLQRAPNASVIWHSTKICAVSNDTLQHIQENIPSQEKMKKVIAISSKMKKKVSC
jgi:hypothetical protein